MGEHCNPHCMHRSLNAKSRCLDVRLLHLVFRASSQFIPGALNQSEFRSSSVCYRKASGLPCRSSAAAWTPLESQPHPVPRAGRQTVFPNPDAVYKLIRNLFGTRASIDTADQRCALLYSSCRGRCGVAQVVFRPRLVLHGEATREGRREPAQQRPRCQQPPGQIRLQRLRTKLSGSVHAAHHPSSHFPASHLHMQRCAAALHACTSRAQKKATADTGNITTAQTSVHAP